MITEIISVALESTAFESLHSTYMQGSFGTKYTANYPTWSFTV